MAAVTIGLSSGATQSTSASGISTSQNGSKASTSNHSVAVGQVPNSAYGAKEFIPRNTKPAADDKCWLKPRVGGYNEAIEIYSWEGSYSYGSVLPNCVGYCWGRVYELSKQYGTELPTRSTLPPVNAKNWLSSTKWATGTQPRLGAVICWGGGEYGHVGMVEKITLNDDGTAVMSIGIGESAWLMYVFSYITRYPGNNFDYSSKYKFQGFIYPPYCSLFSADGHSQNNIIAKETILLVEEALARYMQVFKSNYDAEDPGFDPEELPPKETPKDADGDDVVVGGNVKVVGLGNTMKTGNGKEVDKIGERFFLKTFRSGFPFPYGLAKDLESQKCIGWFSSSAIQKV